MPEDGEIPRADYDPRRAELLVACSGCGVASRARGRYDEDFSDWETDETCAVCGEPLTNGHPVTSWSGTWGGE